MEFYRLAAAIANGGATREVYEESHRSLMSYVVTVDEFVAQMTAVEQCEVLGLKCCIFEPDTENTFDAYVLPYPYTSPCRPEYVDIPIADLTVDIAQDWSARINERIAPFLHRALRYDSIAALDNIPNLGLIIHSYDGSVQAFDYTELDYMLITKLHDAFLPALEYTRYTHNYGPCANRYAELFRTDDKFRLLYTLVFKTDAGDGYQENNSTDMLYDSMITYNSATNWGRYILECVKRKSHLIIIP